jgi:predicted extracellular nuclease
MRIASFNVENLFSRVCAMNMDSWADGKEILAQYSELNTLLQNETYSNSIKKEIIKSIQKLGLKKSDESKYVILRQNHGRLLKRPQSGPIEIVANGRADWIGWLELKKEAVNDVAVKMAAKVIKEVNADILTVIEAEDRIAICNFNNQLLKPIGSEYDKIMLIDGNDERGIDVGILMKPNHQIESIVSHVDDSNNGSLIFSRDCPEYLVNCNGEKILVMINHFKSKGYGSQADSDARRKLQAQRVKELYDLRKSQGIKHIAIVGDFNDTPERDPLSPLLKSELKDIFKHDNFKGDGRPGTYGNGAESNKIDYILLSPALYDKVSSGGVCRNGVWGGKNGTIFPHYDEIKKPEQAASDHAAIWADIDI